MRAFAPLEECRFGRQVDRMLRREILSRNFLGDAIPVQPRFLQFLHDGGAVDVTIERALAARRRAQRMPGVAFPEPSRAAFAAFVIVEYLVYGIPGRDLQKDVRIVGRRRRADQEVGTGNPLLAAGYDISKLTPYLRPGIGQRDLTPFRYDKDGLNRNGGRWRVEVAKELLQRCGKSAALEASSAIGSDRRASSSGLKSRPERWSTPTSLAFNAGGSAAIGVSCG